MSFLDKNGLQVITTKLVQGDAIKVASHRGHTVKNVIDNIQRECENVATPNTMTLESRVSEFKVGQGRDVDVSGDVEEGKVEVELKGKTYQNLCDSNASVSIQYLDDFKIEDTEEYLKITRNAENYNGWFYFSNKTLEVNMLKPNTTYTVFFKYESINNNIPRLQFMLGDATQWLSDAFNSVRLKDNIYRCIIKTASSFDEKEVGKQVIYFHNAEPKKTGCFVTLYKNMLLLEGDLSDLSVEEIPSFFINIKSSFEDGVVDIQIAETSCELSYEKKISFNIGEPLRSLPNGVCDEIRNNKGQWELVRRTAKVVLNGSETWINSYSSWTNKVFCCHNDYLPNIKYAPTDVSNVLSTLLPPANIGTLCNKLGYTGICTHAWNKERLQVAKKGVETVEQLKSWLSKNPMTVYYELETPTITPVEPIEFEVKPLANMTINSEIAPVSNHKVVLNRAGQIERGIAQIAELKKRVDALEVSYDSYLLETQHKLSILRFEYELESEEI